MPGRIRRAVTRAGRWRGDLPPDVEAVGAAVLDAAYFVHSALGPGMLESAYRRGLAVALRNRGHEVEEEVWLDFVFEGVVMPRAFRMDVVVDGRVVVEVKAVEAVLDVHTAQLVSYLRMSGLQLGYVLNFNEPSMRYGIHRRIHSRVADPREPSRPSRSGEPA